MGDRRDGAYRGSAVAGWSGAVGIDPGRRDDGPLLHGPRYSGDFRRRRGKFLGSHPHRVASRSDSHPSATTQEARLTAGPAGYPADPVLMPDNDLQVVTSPL